jgi:hypothetical protein
LRLPALLAASASLLPGQVAVAGRASDENSAPVPGARIEFHTPSLAQPLWTVSDTQGRFRLELPAAGAYLIRAQRPGFFVLEQKVAVEAGSAEVAITLTHLREFVESVDVVYSPPVIDPEETTEQKQLNNMEIVSAPYPAPQDFRNALPLFPGVLQDTRGRLHFNGGATEQTNFTLEGFNIADPVTGLLETRLSIDAVRTLDLESSRFSVDKGRGSAAALDIKTGMGDDRWRFGVTNFIPSVSTQRGWIVSKWTPRLTASGPLARGRAWFHNGFDAFYDVDTIEELPRGQDRTRSLTGSDLTRLQVNVTPANILTAGFLVNYLDTDNFGLSFLDPVETTLHKRQSFVMGMARHQAYLGRGLLLEFGFAFSRGVLRDNPQGQETYEFSPEGRRGNYFVDLSRRSDRQQWIANAILPAWNARGQHQFKVGLNLERTGFSQETSRHDYRVLRSDGSTARYVYFSGNGVLGKKNFESALYGHDRWSPRDDLLLEMGVRFDWDQIVRDLLISPRVSAAWSPRWLRDTKVAAGIGVFNDAFALGTLTRHQDQLSIATFFSRSGLPVRGPVETGFLVNEQSLQSPRARLWSLTVERKLPFGLHGKAAYLRRSGWKGFIFVEPRGENDPAALLYTLANQRSDRYNALEFSVRRTFSGQFEWMASYVYSRSRSNAIVDYSLENPVFAPQAPGPVSWDSPHRLLAWGWAPIPQRILPKRLQFLVRETSAQYLLESRSGFPFGVVNEEGSQVGQPNERRLPYYFNINLHLERRFRFFRYLWAFRFGFNNLTNHGNPNVVNNNIDSPDFLAYGRGQHRAFNVRLRLLGKR